MAVAALKTEAPKAFYVLRESRIYPSADVVFSFLFSDKVVFAELMSSIMGEKIDANELYVKSQVTMAAAEDFNEVTVRLDVRGINKKWLMAAEMQNDFRKALTDDRSPYYHAVLMASQEVENMRYDKLKTVCITFILPTKELIDSDGIRHLEWADVKTGQFIENSDRRYFLYIPNILKNEDIRATNPILFMFARFFEVFTQEQANKFLVDYKNEPLARRLIHMSNVLYQEKSNVREMYTIPYYDRKAFIEEIAALEQIVLQTEQERLRAEQERLHAEQEKLNADQERINAEHKKMQAEQERINAVQEKVQAEQEKVQAVQELQKTKKTIEYFITLIDRLKSESPELYKQFKNVQSSVDN